MAAFPLGPKPRSPLGNKSKPMLQLFDITLPNSRVIDSKKSAGRKIGSSSPVAFSTGGTNANNQREKDMASEGKPISSPIAVAYYPSLAAVMISIGLLVTASFFIYEATSTKKTRSFTKELVAGAVASVFLGFGSLFLLLASGVYV